MRTQDFLLGLFVTLSWGTGFAAAKAGLDQFPPILLMTLRFALAALVLVWFVKPPWGLMWRIFLISLVSATIQYTLTFTGLQGLDASTAIVVVQLEVPLAALVAALVLRDSLGWQRFFGMLLAFSGVALIAGQPQTSSSTLSIILVIEGAAFWAIGQVMIKVWGKASGLTLIAWVAVFSTPQLLVSSLLFETGQLEAIAAADWFGWGVVLYLGLIMTAMGYTVWYHLLTKYDVNQVTPFLLLLPVVTVTESVLFLDEQLSWPLVIGGLIAIIGVAIILQYKKPEPVAVTV